MKLVLVMNDVERDAIIGTATRDGDYIAGQSVRITCSLDDAEPLLDAAERLRVRRRHDDRHRARPRTTDLAVHPAAHAAGDAQAFGRFLAGAEQRLRRALASFAARVDTEAVLQESLLRLWQIAPRFVADGRPNSNT